MSAPNFLRNSDSPNVPPIARGLSTCRENKFTTVSVCWRETQTRKIGERDYGL